MDDALHVRHDEVLQNTNMEMWRSWSLGFHGNQGDVIKSVSVQQMMRSATPS